MNSSSLTKCPIYIQVEKHSNDLGNATRTITELRTKVDHRDEKNLNSYSQVTELENKLISNNKELHAAQDLNQALQHEYKETMAQKEDQVLVDPFWKFSNHVAIIFRRRG